MIDDTNTYLSSSSCLFLTIQGWHSIFFIPLYGVSYMYSLFFYIISFFHIANPHLNMFSLSGGTPYYFYWPHHHITICSLTIRYLSQVQHRISTVCTPLSFTMFNERKEKTPSQRTIYMHGNASYPKSARSGILSVST